ncbi:MAG: hypothetical protein ACLRSD_07285 [Oscillibacter sp.]
MKSLVTICLTVTFCVLTVQTKVTQEFNTVYLMVSRVLLRHAERQDAGGELTCATAVTLTICARTWRRTAGR